MLWETTLRAVASGPTRLGSGPDVGYLSGECLEPPGSVRCSGSIGTGSPSPPGRGSSSARPAGTLGFAPAQRSGREARPDPSDDQVSRRCGGGFRRRSVCMCDPPLL